ncbi:MAG TPA: family 20 glycosylhydrolase, partial [Pseudoxanthomonas sp.]|nr:family 20 glycosylhydrolase [Pseudoxanthomonas sp.]
MTQMKSSRRIAPLLIALALTGLSACQPQDPPAATASADNAAQSVTATTLGLIPAPASLQAQAGEFRVDAGTALLADGTAAQQVAAQFASFLSQSHGLALKPATAAAGNNDRGIHFVIDPAAKGASPEAYTLDVGPSGVRVSARDARGLFYGAVTLWQLLVPAQGKTVTLPALHIEDTPRFAWRGLMLDSARHFWSVEQVKQTIDAMALHKLNTFHWHLTDDQGWRIEIKKYPKLTEVGGCRIPAGDGGKDPV